MLDPGDIPMGMSLCWWKITYPKVHKCVLHTCFSNNNWKILPWPDEPRCWTLSLILLKTAAPASYAVPIQFSSHLSQFSAGYLTSTAFLNAKISFTKKFIAISRLSWGMLLNGRAKSYTSTMRCASLTACPSVLCAWVRVSACSNLFKIRGLQINNISLLMRNSLPLLFQRDLYSEMMTLKRLCRSLHASDSG